MAGFGNVLLGSIKKRITSGTNAKDETSKQLKGTVRDRYIPYARQKQNRGLNPYRDWVYSGHLMRSMKVVSASENRFTIGFIDDRSDKIAHVNNRQDKMFGASPTDMEALHKAIYDGLRGGNVIRFQRVA